MINKNNKTKKKQSHSYREETDGCPRAVLVGMYEKLKGIKRYKLPVIKYVTGM